MVKDLPDGKAAGLFDIMNELWKHCNGSMLGMLLDFLNLCLVHESESVLTNTRLIALIETAHKILSKILSDRILLVCSVFDVFHSDNFFVLKGTTIQFLIFAIGLVVEDALEKINMQKTYNSVNWHHLWNSLMYDGLDQDEKSLCGYYINSRFVTKIGRLENQDGLTLFLAAGVFVNDTIWVENSQTATQYILDIANKFFSINNISINNEKTVAIPINRRMGEVSLLINGLLISIAHREESYRYLGIYLLSESLSKPSLAKAHSDVRFFVNLVLKKFISDKQFLYLVLTVLQLIVGYRSQFSFLSKSNFLNNALYHLSLYGLKSFEQLQTECKMASVLSFLNVGGLLSYLFIYRSLDLQVLTSVIGKDFNPKGPVLYWFNLACDFLAYSFSHNSLSVAELQSLDVNDSDSVFWLKQCLFISNLNIVEVYTDRSLKNFGMQKMECSAAAYFSDVNLSIGIKVNELVSFTLAELQTALDTCAAESVLASLNFCNHCWMKQHGVVNLIKEKRLSVFWHKIKGHSSVLDNECANELADLVHFAQNVFRTVNCDCWEIELGSAVINKNMIVDVNWVCIALVWHPNLLNLPILKMLSLCTFDDMLYTTLSKGFLFRDWYLEIISVLGDTKFVERVIIDFVRSFGVAHHANIWLVKAKYRAFIKKSGLVYHDGSVFPITRGLLSLLSAEVVRLLGVAKALGVCFGFCKLCCFFSGIDSVVSVMIDL
ncbi:hypothetical protein G9A89_002610 [Geosiphon pyriformis]|nr:hypothetical protein G9A89_002610 [Geosiphon pyriformis]